MPGEKKKRDNGETVRDGQRYEMDMLSIEEVGSQDKGQKVIEMHVVMLFL